MPNARNNNGTVKHTLHKNSRDFFDKASHSPDTEDGPHLYHNHRATNWGDRNLTSQHPPPASSTHPATLNRQPQPLTRQNLRSLDCHGPPAASCSSNVYMRNKSSPSKRDKKKQKEDGNSHPLNLPPDELRRLSAAMARDEPVRGASMDSDPNHGESAASSAAESTATTPLRSAPGAFPEPTNGTTHTADADDSKSPLPPPHRVAPKPKVDAEACKATGNKFFKAKDYPKAIAEYTKAVEAEPSNPTYLSNRAAAHISANQYPAALADSLRANELDPGNPKILHRLARIYTSLGRLQDALDTYKHIPGGVSAKDTSLAQQTLQAIKSAEATLKDDKGSGSMALWSLDQADKCLGSAVTRPRKWQLLRGEAYLKIGSANALGEAQSISMSLLRNNSTDADALVLRGRAFYQTGENDNAMKHFRQALSFDPDLSQARTYLKTVQRLDKAKADGNAAFKAGRYSEATKLYTQALEVDPGNKGTNSKILQNRAMSRMKTKEFREAIDDCDQALKLDPSYLKAKKTRAKALGESGNWEQAVKDLKEIAEQNPEEPGIKKEVRSAEMELKKSKRKDYYKILNIDKDANETEIKKAYRKLAIVHHPDKNPDDEEAAERFKDIGEAYETLSDPQKRERYDSGADLVDPSDMFGGGMPGGMGGFGGGGMGGVQIDPEMLFNMMGGMGGGRGGGGGGPQFHFSNGGRGGGGGAGAGGFPFG